MSKANRIQRAVLKAEPACRLCAQRGAAVPATTARPIVAIDQGGALVRSNFQPLCDRHAGMDLKLNPALARILRRKLRQRLVEAGDRRRA